MSFRYPSIRRLRSTLLAAVALLACASAASPTRADFVISVQSVTVKAGSTGNALDVFLTNTGPAATFGGFSFGLNTAAGLTFTSVTTGTTGAAYIFNGHSLFGPDITSTPAVSGVAIGASDLYDTLGAGTTLATGAVVGLGHVLFNVAANASGSINVALSAYPVTSLSTPAGANVPITTLAPGTVQISSGAAVPEPASCLLLGTGLAGLLGYARRRRGGRPACICPLVSP